MKFLLVSQSTNSFFQLLGTDKAVCQDVVEDIIQCYSK